MGERPPTLTLPHIGADDGPVETIACPTDEPAALINEGGTVVAANATDARNAAVDATAVSNFFIDGPRVRVV
ncbi:hypothetical protein BURMUCGD1_2159 [Burkholderia multivorans CGD1]|nr:hypothetical protein BURMUCGD1_2159 [Burkholderia multivorans CGD1]